MLEVELELDSELSSELIELDELLETPELLESAVEFDEAATLAELDWLGVEPLWLDESDGLRSELLEPLLLELDSSNELLE